jgi:hypothetical protein
MEESDGISIGSDRNASVTDRIRRIIEVNFL